MNTVLKNKFEELEKTSNEFWNIPKETGVFLNSIIKSCEYKNIIEVGTSNGYSGLWLASAVKETSGHVFSIEFYQGRIDLALANFKECDLLDFITVYQGSATPILENTDFEKFFQLKTGTSNIDMVFIDANKPEYIQYYGAIAHKIKKGGLLAADNTISHQKKVQDFLDKIEQSGEYQITTLPFGGGITLCFKVV